MKLLQFIFLFLLSQTVFATTTSHPCPAPNFISQTHFKTAALCNDAYGIWCLFSEPFQYQNQEWNIRFAAVLPSVITPKEALQQGTEYFNRLNLAEPQVKQKAGQLECIYAKSNQFLVGAYTPKVGSFPEIE